MYIIREIGGKWEEKGGIYSRKRKILKKGHQKFWRLGKQNIRK